MTQNPTTNKPFTTEDADRLLGLADQFLEDWAVDAVKDGKPDSDYEERNAEWEAIRPLFERAPAMLAALQACVEQMGQCRKLVDDPEFAAALDEAQAVLAGTR